MPDLPVLWAFFGTSVLLALSPGPDNFYVLAQSATHGARAGLSITLGLCTGLMVHTALVAFGLAAALSQSPWVLEFLQWVGAGYLFYLALNLWRSAPQNVFGQTYELGLARLYGKGVVLNLSNPKVSLFFLFFLPQFVNPKGWPAPQQIALLGGFFASSALLVFGSFSLLGGWLTGWLNRNPAALVRVNRLSALCLAVVAITVLFGDADGSKL